MSTTALLVEFSEVLFGIGLFISLGICWFGYESYRRWRVPGTGAFGAFALTLGAAGVLGGVVSIVYTPVVGEVVVWSRIAFQLFVLASVPWGLFALHYTGTYSEMSVQAILLLLLPIAIFFGLSGLEWLVQIEGPVLTAIIGGIGAVISVYHIGLFALGIFLIARTIYEYDHLLLRLGGVLVFVPLVALLAINIVIVSGIQNVRWVAGAYVLAYGIPMVGIGVALFRYRMFDSSPAVGAIGKERIVQESEDIVFVVDRDERVITLNASAVDTLGINRSEALGNGLETVFGHSITDLSGQKDVSVETVDGIRQYDSELSTLADQHDQPLGTMVSLRDVTERNLREQRLMVLNRILRHNLRNRVDVLKSHAEALDVREADTHHHETAMDEADSLIDIARRARSIDRFVDASTEPTRVDIQATVEHRLERVPTDQRGVTISLEFPEVTTVVTNREALESALDGAIKNAIVHAETTVTVSGSRRTDSIEITVSDDGPGIPEHELNVIEAGEETSLTHGTGLGLWQLKWAVMAMHGELSIESTDGTTVTIQIPDLSSGNE